MKVILTILIFSVCSLSLWAQVAEEEDLFQLLKTKDSLLFNAAFDRCDADALATFFTEDFEFYHDKGGVSEGRSTFINVFKSQCAERDPQLPQPAKRILIPGSLQVFPLRNSGKLYGALQHGIHRFESLNASGQYERGDIAKFTHLWILEDDQWKVRRELSYDHQSSK